MTEIDNLAFHEYPPFAQERVVGANKMVRGVWHVSYYGLIDPMSMKRAVHMSPGDLKYPPCQFGWNGPAFPSDLPIIGTRLKFSDHYLHFVLSGCLVTS